MTIRMVFHYSSTLIGTGRGLKLCKIDVCQPAYDSGEASRGHFLAASPVSYSAPTTRGRRTYKVLEETWGITFSFSVVLVGSEEYELPL